MFQICSPLWIAVVEASGNSSFLASFCSSSVFSWSTTSSFLFKLVLMAPNSGGKQWPLRRQWVWRLSMEPNRALQLGHEKLRPQDVLRCLKRKTSVAKARGKRERTQYYDLWIEVISGHPTNVPQNVCKNWQRWR